MLPSRPTLNQIYTRILADMQARVTSGTKILRFSLLGVLAYVFAGAVHLTYGFLSNILDQLFADTAASWFLDRLANLYGLPRKNATFATGSILLTGTEGTNVPEGTQVQNSEGYTYSTLNGVILTAGGASVDIQADTAGADSNSDETTLQLVYAIAGVDTDTTATTTPNGGQDLETDTELQYRLLQRIRNPPASGTAADYIRWGLEIAGVGKAWTLSAENYAGAGTVALVIATTDLEVVDTAVKTNTQTYVDSVRPVGAQADVLDIIPQSVVLNVSLSDTSTEVVASVNTNLTNLFIAETEPGGTMPISHIRSAISKSGVDDYEITAMYVGGLWQPTIGDIVTTGLNTAVFDTIAESEL